MNLELADPIGIHRIDALMAQSFLEVLDGQQPALLVVDDETAVVLAVRKYFGSLGFAVTTAANREEAERQILDHEFNVVIGDLRLSRNGDDDEGLAVVRAARARSEKTVYVILTAFGSLEIERRGRELGPDDFVQKPCSLPALAERVLELLQARRER